MLWIVYGNVNMHEPCVIVTVSSSLDAVGSFMISQILFHGLAIDDTLPFLPHFHNYKHLYINT